MNQKTFTDYLRREADTVRIALTKLYEERDRLLYKEAPALREEYMEKIGNEEETILQAELVLALLRKKVEMVQIAVNRRESVDMQEIDARLQEEKKKLIGDLEKKNRELPESPLLTPEQEKTMQRQYREITGAFHPGVHDDLSEEETALYEKALDAYQMQDPEEMQLVYDVLFGKADFRYTQEVLIGDDWSRGPYRPARLRREDLFTADYYLAKRLYAAFETIEEDLSEKAVFEELEEQKRLLEYEISRIRNSFPFTAKETLSDPAKTEAYLAQLKGRWEMAKRDKDDLEKKIAAFLER